MLPRWFFLDAVKRAVKADVRFFHCFHPRDEAVEISRQRRGLAFPVPGNGNVVKGLAGFAALDCSNAKASYGNHDYGRLDHTCVAEQANFLDGHGPDDRPNCERTDQVGLFLLKKAPA